MTPSRPPSRRSGTSSVEFALVLPLLTALLFGFVEFGNALYAHHVVDQGVRDAVRYLSRVPLGAGWGQSVADAETLALRGSLNAGAAPRLSWWTDPATLSVSVIDQPNPTDAAGQPLLSGGATIPVIQVSARVPYPGLFLGLLGIGPITFGVTEQQRHIGE